MLQDHTSGGDETSPRLDPSRYMEQLMGFNSDPLDHEPLRPVKDMVEPIILQHRDYQARDQDEVELKVAVEQLFNSVGPLLWPDDQGKREAWLVNADTNTLGGVYPKNLYFTVREDRDWLHCMFSLWVGVKCRGLNDAMNSAAHSRTRFVQQSNDLVNTPTSAASSPLTSLAHSHTDPESDADREVDGPSLGTRAALRARNCWPGADDNHRRSPHTGEEPEPAIDTNPRHRDHVRESGTSRTSTRPHYWTVEKLHSLHIMFDEMKLDRLVAARLFNCMFGTQFSYVRIWQEYSQRDYSGKSMMLRLRWRMVRSCDTAQQQADRSSIRMRIKETARAYGIPLATESKTLVVAAAAISPTQADYICGPGNRSSGEIQVASLDNAGTAFTAVASPSTSGPAAPALKDPTRHSNLELSFERTKFSISNGAKRSRICEPLHPASDGKKPSHAAASSSAPETAALASAYSYPGPKLPPLPAHPETQPSSDLLGASARSSAGVAETQTRDNSSTAPPAEIVDTIYHVQKGHRSERDSIPPSELYTQSKILDNVNSKPNSQSGQRINPIVLSPTPSPSPEVKQEDEESTPAQIKPYDVESSDDDGAFETAEVLLNWQVQGHPPDYLPIYQYPTVEDFFLHMGDQMPDELQAEGREIKEVKVWAAQIMEGPSLDCRIRRGPSGRIALGQMLRKLRAYCEVGRPEISVEVVWGEKRSRALSGST